jgi:hypothetical protein
LCTPANDNWQGSLSILDLIVRVYCCNLNHCPSQTAAKEGYVCTCYGGTTPQSVWASASGPCPRMTLNWEGSVKGQGCDKIWMDNRYACMYHTIERTHIMYLQLCTHTCNHLNCNISRSPTSPQFLGKSKRSKPNNASLSCC